MDIIELRKANQTNANKLRQFISSMTFIDLAIITKVYSKYKRVDVQLPYKDEEGADISIKGVELLRLGTKNVEVVVEPQEGDCVLLLCPRSYVKEQVFNLKPSTEDYDTYGFVNIKAVLIQPGTLDENAPIKVYIDKDNKTDVSTQGDLNITANTVTINNHFKVTS